MRDTCLHAGEDIRKILYRGAKTLSTEQLDLVMEAVKEAKNKTGGILYRRSFTGRLKELRDEHKITEMDFHAIIDSLFED
ncbi:MAG: hypothetical protein AAB692_00800 [Patescibacteria group bacterium]